MVIWQRRLWLNVGGSSTVQGTWTTAPVTCWWSWLSPWQCKYRRLRRLRNNNDPSRNKSLLIGSLCTIDLCLLRIAKMSELRGICDQNMLLGSGLSSLAPTQPGYKNLPILLCWSSHKISNILPFSPIKRYLSSH